MMDSLRTISNHIVLKIVLALIVLSFVLAGAGDFLFSSKDDYAAKVNGQKITQAQLARALIDERTRLQQMLGEQFSQLADRESYMQQIRQQVVSQLVDELLLEQYADKLKWRISDEQIKQAIFAQPAFQSDGKFDNEKYLSLVKGIGFSAEQYAEKLRKKLKLQQLMASIANTDFMLNSESEAFSALIFQQRTVRTATINVDQMTGHQQVSDEDINNYYQENENRFTIPEQFKVSYIALDVANMKESVTTEEEIEQWYNQHKADYSQPVRHRYSIIQTKTKAEAQKLLSELEQGANFVTLAQEKSVDPVSKRKGGDMGWMEPTTTLDELKTANLTEKGQLSGVITSSVGFLIARLDDIQPEQTKPLAEVHDVVANKVEQEKAIDDFYKMQQKVSEAANSDNKSLVSAEKIAGVKAAETDWFNRDNVPTELDFKPIKQAIFNGGLLAEGDASGSNSDIITVDGDRAFVVRISAHQAEKVKPLTEVQGTIVSIIKHDKAKKEAKSEAQKIVNELKVGNDESFKAANLQFGEQQKLLSRFDQRAIVQDAFILPHPKDNIPSYGISEDEQGNVILVSLEQVQATTLPEQQKQMMILGITQNNTQVVFDALLNNLRKQATIKYANDLKL